VVPVGDVGALAAALTEVVADPQQLSGMRAAGMHRAADFTWAAVADRMWGLYGRVLDHRG
jgi:glycosyltransferase involved in cell wall biosynthesis